MVCLADYANLTSKKNVYDEGADLDKEFACEGWTRQSNNSGLNWWKMCCSSDTNPLKKA